MTDDLKKLAEAVIAAREAWSALPFRAPDHVSGPVNERCDEAIDAFNFAATPAAILALIRERDEARGRERQTFKDASEINAHSEASLTAMAAERDAARKQVDGFRLSQSLDKDSAYVIRELLDRHNVPAAAFIDDHVANAIAQRDAAEAALSAEREEVERLLSAMDREEAYLHRMIDASEENGGIMHGDLEGAFHRIRDKDSDTSTGEEYELGPDLQWRRIEASGTNEKGAG